ncbi:uncharacterized protein LOC119082017 [Bradysia coprophila]|uniref:uncharacterized protein LOC119082017 n=1 Tax=Bradysia coprophila TaxID=38358 RepID=UPI00187DA037|nr:uncharacterized protein LOC119082017 [Bradysia coprophila]
MENKIEALREKIARFIIYCDEIVKMPEPNLSRGYLEAKKLMVANMWSKIESANDEIAENAEKGSETKREYLRKDYDTAFTLLDKVAIRIQTKLEKFGPVAAPVKSQESAVANDKPNIKLKAMDIPIFSGEYENWISFRNMFESLVHNKKYDDVDKMHYLKSCVDGDAERVISQYDISAEAYGPAYAALVDRFHNEAILIDTHIIKILSQPNLNSESGNGLKEMMDVTTVNIQALKSLKVRVEYWDPILLLLLVQKLDGASRRLWEQKLKPKTLPTMDDFLEFLKVRFHALGCQQKFNFSIEPSTNNSRSKGGSFTRNSSLRYETPNFPPRIHQTFHTSTGRQGKCPFRCNTTHEATKCDRFLRVDTCTRMDLVACARLCKNCLKPHSGKCSLQPGCGICNSYHHELLHPHNTNSSRGTTSTRTTNNSTNSSGTSNGVVNPRTSNGSQTSQDTTVARSSHHIYVEPRSSEVNSNVTSIIAWDESILLSTAIVLVRSQRDDRFYAFRALLDDASEVSYASEFLVQTLGLRKKHVLANATGLGGVKTGQIKHTVSFEISSKHNPTFSMMVEAPVTKKITQPLPSTLIARRNWSHIKDLPLADPQFHIPSKIDLLLGASVYGYLMLPGLVKASPQEPVARYTEFGWIISGPVRDPSQIRQFSSLHLRIDIDNQLKRFFEQEEVSKERILTKEETECEQFYMKTYRRNEEGRFVVALPFKGDPETLGSSQGQAIARLTHLEQRFSKNAALKTEYTDILKEYERLGHTTNIGPLNNGGQVTQSYYLPHHAVFKPESTSTKTRIVFDASAKGTGGVSLNELLMTGPTLQEDLRTILMRWRSHRFSVAADIKKMYRQVEVRQEDRKFQKFLSRDEETGQIHEHQHNMVTFGVTSATYLAVKSLQQLAEEEKKDFPEAAEVVKRDFYMDDGMSGSDTEQACVELCKDLKNLLARGKFELSKFISNSDKVLESVPEEDREIKLPMEIELGSTVKTLGVLYHPTMDVFRFKVNLKIAKGWPTKRSLLSETSRLYDPLGWLAPVIIRAKILFQKLWEAGLNWDDDLPKHIAETWIKIRTELHLMEDLNINRWIGKGGETVDFQLHGFSDASEDAYAACVYSRVIDHNGTIQVTLITSKTRVAPLKRETLPRLELCGLVLLVNLMADVRKAYPVTEKELHAWTDSTIVLGWLSTNPARLKTYVANRVVEANNFLNGSQCHHIEGTKNPADCASRGLNPSELKEHDLWWKGPDCLREHKTSWDQQLEIPPVTLELKAKAVATNLNVRSGLDQLLERFSDFNRIIRIVAICNKFLDGMKNTRITRVTTLCLTFINNLRTVKQKPRLVITAVDLRRAELLIVKLTQEQDFAREIHSLAGGKDINKKSKIIALTPFLDTEGCLRVGGRLSEANLPYERQHPLILASGKLAKLIITDRHGKMLHGGVKITINSVREDYWILNLRSQVKMCIRTCVKCVRFKKENTSQIMADLPAVRVNVSLPFTMTGLDYAGPYDIKASNVRSPPIRVKTTMVNGKIVKSIPKVPIYEGYIAIFVCLATKATHLEVVSDKSTEAFLAAFDRFTARKGFPECCYSDNALTFIGAKPLLAPEPENSLLDFSKVNEHSTKNGTDWKFITPRAPHQGGIWEAGVKAMKHHLKRVIGANVLTFEEMTTITAKIEACLNSRPLCQLNDDPEELSVLTPGHFLVGRPLMARPERNSTNKNIAKRNRWRMVEAMQRDFWKSWSNEYLNELQTRQKWRTETRNFKENDIVLVNEDNAPPLKWPLARIVKVHPSTDGNVRSATVRMAGESGKFTELKRPIVKFRLLPMEEDEVSGAQVTN